MSDILTTFRFEVLLDLERPVDGLTSPLCDGAFAECDGLEMTMEPRTVESASVTDRQQRLIGPTRYGQITLKRGMTTSPQLWVWFSRGTRPGSVLHAAGQITMWQADGTPALRFVLERCLPTRLRAPSLNAREGVVAIEELGLVCERMTVELPDSGGAAGGAAPGGPSLGGGASVGASLGVSF